MTAETEEAVRRSVERDLTELHREELLDALEKRPARPGKVEVLGEAETVGEWWFVGDLHGDLVALEVIVAELGAIPAQGPRHIVFLGDLVDDGPHGLEVFLRIAELASLPGLDVKVLAGNHDEGVRIEDGSFRSDLNPGEFAAWLERNREDHFVRKAAEAFVAFFSAAPRALFFPDGLFVSHAGFPLTDLHPALVTAVDLESPECLQDFVWTRAGRTRRKIPNRTTRGCQFGFLDLEAFCRVAETVLGRPVNRLIRGHDHAEERYDAHVRYDRCPLLTLNALSHRLPREAFGPWLRPVVAARYVPGNDVEVFRWGVSEEVVGRFYPPPGES